RSNYMETARNQLEARGVAALILTFLVNLAAMEIAANFIPGVEITSFRSALLAAAALALASYLIEPLLYLLTLPINLATFGTFSLVINAFMLIIVAFCVPGFHFKASFWGLLPAIITALTISFFRIILRRLLIQARMIKRRQE
ncbi:MAG: phage holin family protein, partial [bacterium]